MTNGSKSELRTRLTDMQYYVTQEKGTERAFTGEYWNVWDAGEYRCICCDAPLFSSENKFDAGCGWPSFDQELGQGVVTELEDTSHGMTRVEVVCTSCGAHLGHVFPDGPRETTGLRYCINSASINLRETPPK